MPNDNKILKAIYKFNNGAAALLCSGCHAIIRQGHELTIADRCAINEEINNPAIFCNKCSSGRSPMGLVRLAEKKK